MQTIAREVGLSKYAVSRSLAGKSGVSEETRALIRETAQRLGYTRPAGQGAAGEVAVVFHDLMPSIASFICRFRTACSARRTGWA